MWIDVNFLYEFYHSPLGIETARIISGSIAQNLLPLPTSTTVGIGYVDPIFHQLNIQPAANLIFDLQLFPTSYSHPQLKSKSHIVLCEEDLWPLADESVDRLVISHTLEFITPKHHMLEQAYRVLNNAGELIIIVPNMFGLWRFFGNTPFKYGCGFSEYTLSKLLIEAEFVPRVTQKRVTLLPSHDLNILTYSKFFESLRFNPLSELSGVIVIHATKETYNLIPFSPLNWVPRLLNPSY